MGLLGWYCSCSNEDNRRNRFAGYRVGCCCYCCTPGVSNSRQDAAQPRWRPNRWRRGRRVRRVPPPDHLAARWCGRQSDVWRLSGRPRMGGHCCHHQKPKNLGVAVGNHKLNHHDKDQENIAVEAVILHEDYDSWTVENDICLLKLEHEATMGDHVQAIELPEANTEYDEGTMCTVSGWGTTSEGGHLAKTLQKVDVPVVSDKKCRHYYGADEIKDSMICAGYDKGGKDSCQGDSGGPFMCGKELTGVVSWGYGCAEKHHPGVYTQTSYFIDWLNTNMA